MPSETTSFDKIKFSKDNSLVYDSAGKLETITDQAGNVTRLEYNDEEQLIKTYINDVLIKELFYNNDGVLISVDDKRIT